MSGYNFSKLILFPKNKWNTVSFPKKKKKKVEQHSVFLLWKTKETQNWEINE